MVNLCTLPLAKECRLCLALAKEFALPHNSRCDTVSFGAQLCRRKADLQRIDSIELVTMHKHCGSSATAPTKAKASAPEEPRSRDRRRTT